MHYALTDLNVNFHEKARKQVFNINQVRLNTIPLKVSYKKESY